MPRDESQTPPATSNFVEFPPPRLPSPPTPRGGHGPGRGAQRPFANQKNRRAQNDLGRRPSTPQKRGAVDQGHSAATERTQALDDEPRRPAQTRCSAARRSFKGQFDSQHRRRYRASRVLEPRPAPPPRSTARERLVTRAPAPRRRRASREGRRRRPSRPRGRRLKHTAAPPRAHHAFAEHREALRRHGDGREQPQERGARRLDRLHLPGGARAQQRGTGVGMRRHPHRCVWRRHLSAATFAPPPSQTRPRPDASHPRDGPRAQAFAGHAEDHWINVVTSRAGGAFAEVRRASRAPRDDRARPAQLWEASLESDVLGVRFRRRSTI